uniref:Uncharacterized protein n=1 Tax=Arundo donax TaxID=35708 RepID=A0A0A9DHS9_ARUDO
MEASNHQQEYRNTEVNLLSNGFNLLGIIIDYLGNILNLLHCFLQRPTFRKFIRHICRQLLRYLSYMVHNLYSILHDPHCLFFEMPDSVVERHDRAHHTSKNPPRPGGKRLRRA